MFKALFALLLASFVSPAFAAEHTKDTDAVVKAALGSQTAVLVDVREAEEWQAGHLKDAINVPLSDIKAGKVSALPKGKTIYLHCQSGRRVLVAADLLKEAKFDDVRPLSSGYPDLIKQGFAPAK